MECPVDQSVLQMTERSGVEIDYCPTCRGVWLDRGELDKILDRAASAMTTSAEDAPDPRTESVGYPQPAGYDPRFSGDQDRRYRDDRQREDSRHAQAYDPRRKRKKSILNEIFDF